MRCEVIMMMLMNNKFRSFFIDTNNWQEMEQNAKKLQIRGVIDLLYPEYLYIASRSPPLANSLINTFNTVTQTKILENIIFMLFI